MKATYSESSTRIAPTGRSFLPHLIPAVAVAAQGFLPSPASATMLSATMTADNAFNLSLSTDDTVAGASVMYGGDWTATFTGSAALTPGVKNYIHVWVQDWGGPAALIGQFTLSDPAFVFANATPSLLTTPAYWQLSGTGFGSGYATPASSGFDGVGPWGPRPGILPAAEWLAFPSGSTSYFSAEIDPVAVPEPSYGVVSVLGLVGLGLYWRKRVAAARA